jgi:hypothetical protein
VWFNFSNVEGSLTGRNEEREKKKKRGREREREREMRKGKKGPTKPNA